MAPCPGGHIEEIAEGSPAARHGLRPGDRLVAINDRPLTDILLYQSALLDDEQVWTIRRRNRLFHVDFDGPFEEDPGVTFSDDLFDGVRRCANRCCFCFVDQLPPGLRPTLYVKDEDYRLSFLHGSYLTLSHLTEEELDTIEELGLSPLYVSVHATDETVRRRLLGRKRLPSILAQIRELAERGVSCWTQIVVCPGLNDGEILSRSMDELADLHPACLGLGVVPVGLTAHRGGLAALRGPTPDEARDCLERIEGAQKRFRSELGTRFVWAADEFYRLAGRTVPGAGSYEGFPLHEDGIGMLRRFRDGLARSLARRKEPTGDDLPRSLVATSRAAAPLFAWAAERLGQAGWPVPEIRVVENRFFSDSVTVAGLLTGADIARACAERPPVDQILFSAYAMRDGTTSFLDDETPESLSTRLGVPVLPVEDEAPAFLDALRRPVAPHEER